MVLVGFSTLHLFSADFSKCFGFNKSNQPAVSSLLSGYNAPYLSVYSENAVDIFDVNSMEWIQTLPLKKVL